MHLFGDGDDPHLAHFQARREPGYVELGWDVHNAPALRWRVLRSEHEFAAAADALPGSGQTIVMEGSDTYVIDDRITEGTPCFYTVFAQDQQGVWHRQVTTKLAHRDRLRWLHPSHGRRADQADDDFEHVGVLQDEAGTALLLTSRHTTQWFGSV